MGLLIVEVSFLCFIPTCLYLDEKFEFVSILMQVVLPKLNFHQYEHYFDEWSKLLLFEIAMLHFFKIQQSFIRKQ
jgi:hypothetical protein